MSEMMKGGSFVNRYLFRGVLTAHAPFHIGSGGTVTMTDDDNNQLLIAAVVTDRGGIPYIPGSSLRGAMRDWLSRVFGEKDREDKELKSVLKGSFASEIAVKQTRMERLFGTVYGEGKIEIWDAPCISAVDTPSHSHWSGWDRDRLTYVAKSVAISPETGTAEDKKLYNFELVPEGVQFRFTVTAQNLSREEAAIVLHALEGFNHPTDPITLGSMTKRGFGSFRCSVTEVYRLSNSDVSEWMRLVADDDRAGFESICRSEFRLEAEDVNELKRLVSLSAPRRTVLRKRWDVTLETPLVVRSGGKFGWRNSSHSKTRNFNMRFRWGAESGELDDISDLYFSIRVNGNDAVPYYHIPSSSIRGALRAWTIKHLLPESWWNIEKALKEHVRQNTSAPLPLNLDSILSLFGFVVNTGNKDIDRKYTHAGRLAIKVEPFSESAPRPYIDGSWADNQPGDSPANAKRHIKSRNPLDRVTNAAKDGGLHSFLEFSSGQSFRLDIIIEDPDDFDREIVDRWRKDINAGMLRFGALYSVGRGRVSISEEA
ncbi:MAG: hypothetical protein GXP46_12315 [Deferribacteres bacterium]|nr:hypothetical protein [Deferribacteres bacterium]